MKHLMIFVLVLFASCSTETELGEPETKPVTNTAPVNSNLYREYYPGTQKVKIEGLNDNEGRRHGKWTYYLEDGRESNYTFYSHGLKNGVSYTAYPNGATQYYGEYENDTMVGVWKLYNKEGKLTTKDYGTIEDRRKK